MGWCNLLDESTVKNDFIVLWTLSLCFVRLHDDKKMHRLTNGASQMTQRNIAAVESNINDCFRGGMISSTIPDEEPRSRRSGATSQLSGKWNVTSLSRACRHDPYCTLHEEQYRQLILSSHQRSRIIQYYT